MTVSVAVPEYDTDVVAVDVGVDDGVLDAVPVLAAVPVNDSDTVGDDV